MIDEKIIIDKLESCKDNLRKFDNPHRTYMSLYQCSCLMDKIIEYIINANEDTDYVKVVRYKNCKWWQNNRCTNINGAYETTIINPDWFCCSGMLKEST